tara:strand:+ start:460 stop:723 length:264 start_codon:yes stop_codon:yes gene_type:complete
MRNIRKGRGYAWSDSYHGAGGHLREQSGFTVDNLDSKHLDQAANKYERVFIIVRNTLHGANLEIGVNEQLQIAQDIADTSRESGVFR